jgi:hypothetical protein
VSNSDVVAARSRGEVIAAVELHEEKVFMQLYRPEESHNAKI